MSGNSASGGDEEEAELLDAYSRAIISDTGKAGPAVVAINVRSDRGGSAGSKNVTDLKDAPVVGHAAQDYA
ncbi:hypothetical protein T484DRAFT_1830829 [Baffinella frigidus]|nr:hypothetical protein T484DRAFT_1830829 [Cryptophyta sp. CCMP2293]